MQITPLLVLLACNRAPKIRRQDLLHLVGYTLASGIKITSYFAAVSLVPLTELTVLCSTIPVFSLILSRIMLGKAITPLRVFLCLTVILGVVFVVQPTAIFTEQSINASPLSNETLEVIEGEPVPNPTLQVDSQTRDIDYYLGLLLTLAFAISCSLTHVTPALATEVPNQAFLFCAGLGTSLVSFVIPLLGIEMYLIQRDLSTVEPVVWLLIFGLGLCSVVFQVLMVMAIRRTLPTIVSMVRRSDIILVIIIEATWFGSFPSIFGWIGIALVLISITGITFADKIETSLSYKYHRRCSSIKQENEDI
ncbi:uncharacterized protein LOC131876852 isoform X2 [Tigriopus californicus]|nr:uncharacterized protein LOC131876852 isoform X2 [Tigriopus californicus]